MATIATKIGRRNGKANRGFWFRAGRGWYDSQRNPLLDPQTLDHLKDPKTPRPLLESASVKQRERIAELGASKPTVIGKGLTVQQAVAVYLEHAEHGTNGSTFERRRDILTDLCTGLPVRFSDGRESTPAERKAARIHDGYGDWLVSDFHKSDVEKWIRSHSGWGNGSARMAIQAIRRCLNYCVDDNRLESNPILGMKVPPAGVRRSTVTQEQEQAIYDACRSDLKDALTVISQLGLRPGCEFGALEAQHVKQFDGHLIIDFPNGTKVRGKSRRILVDAGYSPDAYRLIVAALAKHPTGRLFRTKSGKNWTDTILRNRLYYASKKATAAGAIFDCRINPYALRHTFGVRMLNGTVTGRPASFKTLSQFLGNSPAVCMKHYSDTAEAQEIDSMLAAIRPR